MDVKKSKKSRSKSSGPRKGILRRTKPVGLRVKQKGTKKKKPIEVDPYEEVYTSTGTRTTSPMGAAIISRRKTWIAPKASLSLTRCDYALNIIEEQLQNHMIFIVKVFFNNVLVEQELGDLEHCQIIIGQWVAPENPETVIRGYHHQLFLEKVLASNATRVSALPAPPIRSGRSRAVSDRRSAPRSKSASARSSQEMTRIRELTDSPLIDDLSPLFSSVTPTDPPNTPTWTESPVSNTPKFFGAEPSSAPVSPTWSNVSSPPPPPSWPPEND